MTHTLNRFEFAREQRRAPARRAVDQIGHATNLRQVVRLIPRALMSTQSQMLRDILHVARLQLGQLQFAQHLRLHLRLEVRSGCLFEGAKQFWHGDPVGQPFTHVGPIALRIDPRRIGQPQQQGTGALVS